jgi:hypothetical protein
MRDDHCRSKTETICWTDFAGHSMESAEEWIKNNLPADDKYCTYEAQIVVCLDK